MLIPRGGPHCLEDEGHSDIESDSDPTSVAASIPGSGLGPGPGPLSDDSEISDEDEVPGASFLRC